MSYAVDDRIAPEDRLFGPAHDTDTPARVAVAHSYHPFAAELGSFAENTSVSFIRMVVFGLSADESNTPPRTVGDASVDITYNEALGWVRAVLETRWSSPLYQYGYERPYCAPAIRFRFGILVDRLGNTLPAPAYFDWPGIGEAPEVAVRRVDAEPPRRGM